MNIFEIAKRGAETCPRVGYEGAFYTHQFVGDHSEWLEKVKAICHEGIDMNRSYDHGTSVGGRHIIRENGFVYLYLTDDCGNLDSQWYTHEVIAGEFEIH